MIIKNSTKNIYKDKEVKITRDAIEFILYAAKFTYPHEFIGLLRQRDDVINEVIILPLSIYGNRFSSLRLDMLPITEHPLGVVHSHPSTNNHPSKQDLLFFNRFGKIHIIVSYPYNLQSVSVYNNKGDKLDFKIVE
ncbi:Mov34/MPN/PAD-1 family protein [Candidatus Micrarchaeota archaeon]|nr:Mov34/MPN/PAD-1 family protein [Candidatus Micrarchaeota archaeon]